MAEHISLSPKLHRYLICERILSESWVEVWNFTETPCLMVQITFNDSQMLNDFNGIHSSRFVEPKNFATGYIMKNPDAGATNGQTLGT